MGASRDLTTGYDSGASAALLDRDVEPRGRAAVETPAPSRAVPSGYQKRITPHVPRQPRRLGSKQVVSVRGRRVAQPTTEVRRRFTAVSVIALPLLIVGILTAMFLSALSTQQTFAVQELQVTEEQLNNEVETLNRDLEDLQSSAEIARRASEAGMVLPVNPGIVNVENDGSVAESRPADPATQPIIDVNGAPVRPSRASSDPEATNEISDALETRPQGNQLAPTGPESPAPDSEAPQPDAPAAGPALAPYAPNVPSQF
ncbi:hypothetical protein QP027_07520 [Corynebacterium breve]|uniref:Cell division protein FtsL n=1 Tax=Corynebacterium breve TaxID=3049799 RepID=A0ABY8VFH4_9CORY|nr:hypothetical protein [Corynebacterium breve]WIM66979.1 hypothetical protein QP027_07520 [Corynebacterium breve]